jgi:hypothetical protein
MKLAHALPAAWMPSLRVAKSLLLDYGHLKSSIRRSSVMADSQPVPWYTYPAIEYVRQLDFRDASVFEYGSGNSTLYWASVAKRVISVEDDDAWYAHMGAQLPPNAELILEADLMGYVDVIERFGREFDIIVVDGPARGGTRLKCSRAVMAHLRPGGMVILDNSDWLPESARVLRESGLIQVDMTGFAPISGRTQTTTFFLHRDFRFQPRGSRQPMPGPGAAQMIWECAPPTEPPLVTCGDEVFGAVTRQQHFSVNTPAGVRHFELIVCGPTSCAREAAAIIDRGRDRVALSITEPTFGGPSVEAELEPAVSMSWERLKVFINAHPKRRYVLEPHCAPANSRTR